MKNKLNSQKKIPKLSTGHSKIKTEKNNFGVLKTILIILLLAIQVALFIMTYLYIATFTKYFLSTSLILTFISCLHVICSNRNSKSKPVWVLFLIITFTFGYIFYFLSDERIIWHKNSKKYNLITKKVNSYRINQLQPQCKSIQNLSTQNYLLNVGQFSAYTSTKSTYLKSGEIFFEELINSLKTAKKFIFMEFFIISDGIILSEILKILKQKVEDKVKVKIIYDDLGSHKSFSRKTKKEIKSSGIELVAFNKILPKASLFLNFRDHRKIVVIDGNIAYTGGINIADEYANKKQVHGFWKDSGLKIEGPAVDGLTLSFLAQWEFLTKATEDYSIYLNHSKKYDNQSILIPFCDGLEYPPNIGKDVFTNMIANATEKIYIMSPYLVIDDAIKDILVLKATAGVDVRIIIPQIADKKLVYVQTRNIAEKLMLKGIKLFTMKDSFVHSKLLLTESACVVGSINFDLRSFYQQFENAVFITDETTTQSVLSDFEDTFRSSIEITPQNMNRRYISFRMLAGLTSIISPFM